MNLVLHDSNESGKMFQRTKKKESNTVRSREVPSHEDLPLRLKPSMIAFLWRVYFSADDGPERFRLETAVSESTSRSLGKQGSKLSTLAEQREAVWLAGTSRASTGTSRV